MPGLRRSLSLVAAAALAACTGRVDTSSTAQPAQAPRPAPGAPAAEPAPPDPVEALAPTLTEEKLNRLLTFEEAILPISAALVTLAAAPGGGIEATAGEPTPAERRNRLDGQLAAALQQHGLVPSDHTGFAALSSGLVLRSAKAAEARERLAKNVGTKKAWAKLEAEHARKKQDPRRPPWFLETDAVRPLPDALEKHLQVQVVQADADRRAFAAKYGDPVLALIDRFGPQILALREKQVRIVTRGR